MYLSPSSINSPSHNHSPPAAEAATATTTTTTTTIQLILCGERERESETTTYKRSADSLREHHPTVVCKGILEEPNQLKLQIWQVINTRPEHFQVLTTEISLHQGEKRRQKWDTRRKHWLQVLRWGGLEWGWGPKNTKVIWPRVTLLWDMRRKRAALGRHGLGVEDPRTLRSFDPRWPCCETCGESPGWCCAGEGWSGGWGPKNTKVIWTWVTLLLF